MTEFTTQLKQDNQRHTIFLALSDTNRYEGICYDQWFLSWKGVPDLFSRYYNWWETFMETTHICKVNEKINKCIGILYKVRNTLNKLMRMKLYKTFVLPHLNYCNIVWESTIVSNLKKLEATQRKAIKFALGVPRDTPTKTIFSEAKVLPLSINKI